MLSVLGTINMQKKKKKTTLKPNNRVINSTNICFVSAENTKMNNVVSSLPEVHALGGKLDLKINYNKR